MRRPATSPPPAPPATLGDVEFDTVGEATADAARSFWQAFASIAAELLDVGDLPGEDHAPEDIAA